MAKDNKQDNKNVSRRNFLKLLGGGAAVTTAAMVGCQSNQANNRGGAALGEVPTDAMTYRTSSSTGVVVSLL